MPENSTSATAPPIVDVPKITQRSIIAYSVLPGPLDDDEWYDCTLRKPFGVESLTSATIGISGGGHFASRCRAEVDGTSIKIQCQHTSTESPSVAYGVSGDGVLTVTVTTAGDNARNIQGATRQFNIGVLVLGKDWPHGDPLFLTFREGESVDLSLGAMKYAKGEWITKAANTGYGVSGPGQSQKIMSYAKGDNNEYLESGLYLHNSDDRMWISGVASRPGLYCFHFDLLSNEQGRGQGSQVYHPFPGGWGNNMCIISIYRDFMPGDLVVVSDKRAQSITSNNSSGAVSYPVVFPFCYAKRGDAGIPLPISGGVIDTSDDKLIMQSIGNMFASTGDFAVAVNGSAGAMWKQYPLRRLLPLHGVGGSVSATLTLTQEVESYSESHNNDGLAKESDTLGEVPSVTEVLHSGGAITRGRVVNWASERLTVTAKGSATVSVPLSYAIWTDGFPKYLEAVLNRVTVSGGVAGTYTRNREYKEKFENYTKTYKVWDPLASDGSGGTISSGGEVVGLLQSGAWILRSAGAVASNYQWTMKSLNGIFNASGHDGIEEFDQAGTVTNAYDGMGNIVTGDFWNDYVPGAGVRGDGRIRLTIHTETHYGEGGDAQYSYNVYYPPEDPDDPAWTRIYVSASAHAEKEHKGRQSYRMISGGGWVSNSSGPETPALPQPNLDFRPDGTLILTVSWGGSTITSSGVGSVSITRSGHEGNGYGDWAQGSSLSAGASAINISGSGSGEDDPRVFVAFEQMGGYEVENMGDPVSATGSSMTKHAAATVTFGEGRDTFLSVIAAGGQNIAGNASSSALLTKTICAAAAGEAGFGLQTSSVSNTQRELQVITTKGGQRSRGSPRDSWTYINCIESDWGKIVTSTTIDETQPETVSDDISFGATFDTGIVGLPLFVSTVVGLSANGQSKGSNGAGNVYGYRQLESDQTISGGMTTDETFASSVQHEYCKITGSSTNGPSSTDKPRGSAFSKEDLNLSELITGSEWDQWGYGYTMYTTDSELNATISIEGMSNPPAAPDYN